MAWMPPYFLNCHGSYVLISEDQFEDSQHLHHFLGKPHDRPYYLGRLEVETGNGPERQVKIRGFLIFYILRPGAGYYNSGIGRGRNAGYPAPPPAVWIEIRRALLTHRAPALGDDAKPR